IERRLLEMAYTTDAKITATSLAYFAPCAIDEAAQLLEGLTARDRLDMEIEDDGTVVYHVRARQRIGAAPPPPIPAPLPVARIAGAQQRTASPALAALLSFFIPGAGHIYTGRAVAAVLWFLVVSMGYVLLLPGLVLHIFSIASAASSAHRL